MNKKNPEDLPDSLPVDGVTPGTDAWQAAQELINSFQGSADRIREGRAEVGHKLGDLWNDWYNNLMVICFGLGGALVALLPSVHFPASINRNLFIVGAVLLILNGLYILLFRKHGLERESRGAITMGYELEYYSLVAKNRVLDVLKGKNFNQKEYEGAKNKLLEVALTGIDQSYDETRKIEEKMDIATLLFLVGLFLIGVSSINNVTWLKIVSIIGLLVLLLLLIYFRSSGMKAKEEIKKRDDWLNKIKPERTRE